MASALFRRGDIFERGADLTVLPCSAKGHISKTAETHVRRFSLPPPPEQSLGEIDVKRFPGAGSITRYIAWAASVMEYKSTPDIIRTIGQRLGQYANDNREIQLIESPLLGTGAGNLDPLVAGPALIAGFRAICTTDATLIVYGQLAKTIESLRTSGDPAANDRIATTSATTPTAFISYSWDSDNHKEWVRNLATRLRADGVDVTLDQWHAVPGDRLTHFMERAIRQNNYVLILCTPQYRQKSDNRTGGVGYEGDIMTGEVYDQRNERKFIPILASSDWETAVPDWLKGKYGIDLSTEAIFPRGYNDLLTTLHNTRRTAPPLGPRPTAGTPTTPEPVTPQPMTILGVIADEVTEPRRGHNPGSALYRIPFRLSRNPTSLWAELFLQAWDKPPQFSTMHRPGIASVTGDKIILDGTTMEEVERYHRDTLVICVKTANEEEKQVIERRQRDEELRNPSADEHRSKVAEISRRLRFD